MQTDFGGKIIVEGVMLGMLTLVTFSIGNNLYGLEVGRTMAFVAIAMLELVHSFNVKSEESIFKVGLFENKYLIGAFILGAFFANSCSNGTSICKCFWTSTINRHTMDLYIRNINSSINYYGSTKEVK